MLPSLSSFLISNYFLTFLSFLLVSFLFLTFLLGKEKAKIRFINYLILFFAAFFLLKNKNFYSSNIIFIFYLFLLNLFQFAIVKIYSIMKKPIKKSKFIKKIPQKNKKKKSNTYGSPQVLTSFGLKVRSKSEVFIAEKLKENNILFTYEKPLSADGKTYYPDFTIYIGKRELYWEHFGLMNDDIYAKKTEIKMKWYNKHFPKKLIWTEENSYLMIQIHEIAEKLAKTKQPPPSFHQQIHEIKERASRNHRI
ncbi:hypothetical protein QEJ31_15620 [Pigmentibacter sp. JX0631]|uniref:hypothetical protein n=1 Tax=Pigmentibacter sp. JX0631 TaxID=2976982 RepID=UPI002469A824|nr:hypothetical protein [Pigmentibacter sp. JX0631]WGL59961.1 hypothetical protein QEJ31_15620 [Pigmentibacter sp. JX0631]